MSQGHHYFLSNSEQKIVGLTHDKIMQLARQQMHVYNLAAFIYVLHLTNLCSNTTFALQLW